MWLYCFKVCLSVYLSANLWQVTVFIFAVYIPRFKHSGNINCDTFMTLALCHYLGTVFHNTSLVCVFVFKYLFIVNFFYYLELKISS